MSTRRPWTSRVWFYRPTLSRPRLTPVWFGGDEWDWHTVVIGWEFTGQVVIATRHCPLTGKCANLADDLAEFGETLREWGQEPCPWCGGPDFFHDCDERAYWLDVEDSEL